MNVIIANEANKITSVEATTIRSLLDSVPVRELEALTLDETVSNQNA